jgi:phage-related protein (TIGR01555 family)
MSRRKSYRSRPTPRRQPSPNNTTRTTDSSEQVRTTDAFVNFAARLGFGANNQSSFGGYAFTPITRNRILLDNAYRGSWICRMAVKAVADDMTREGVTLGSDMDPDDLDKMYTAFNKKYVIWDRLAEAIGWGRLYGGGGAVILIDGQDMESPLRIDTIGKGQFCGLLPVDRWMIDPTVSDLVTDLKSLDLGLPRFYNVLHDAPTAPRAKVHHSRFIRFDGDDLPYYQRLSENMWGLSVLEPVFDRILAFDSATTGTAQLVYRAHLRTYGIEGLRDIIGKGGKILEALLEQIDMMRMWQSNEGITLMDSKDNFEATQYTFGGLDSVLIQMGQQISGALQIPLVRLFGQSPTGLNSTGESDLRMYYDGVRTQQERRLRTPMEKLIRIIAKSEEVKLPDNFNFEFVPLWQLTSEQKAGITATVTQTVLQAFESGVVPRGTALKEMRKLSADTGIWASITDEEVEAAESEPPLPQQMQQQQGSEEQGAPDISGLNANIPSPTEGDSFLPGSNVIPLRPLAGSRQAGEDERAPGFTGFLPGAPSLKDDNDSAGAHLYLEGLEAIDPTINDPNIEIYKKKKPVHVYVEDQDKDGDAVLFAGFPVIIEYRRGEVRNAGSSDGAVMSADYGYFPGTTGIDGDSVDVFLGPNERSDLVFIINQRDPDDGEFVQHKCFLGFDKSSEVVDTFNSFYNDGRGEDRLHSGNEMTLGEFKTWMMNYKDGRRRRSRA